MFELLAPTGTEGSERLRPVGASATIARSSAELKLVAALSPPVTSLEADVGPFAGTTAAADVRPSANLLEPSAGRPWLTPTFAFGSFATGLTTTAPRGRGGFGAVAITSGEASTDGMQIGKFTGEERWK
jgi:hypothetical protein